MRTFLLLAAGWLLTLLAGAAPLPADTAAVVPVNTLTPKGSTNGLLLTRGWRYQLGDNPAWARPDFDERGWDTLNPARPRRELPAGLRTGISWLRLRFRLADSLRQRAVLLQADGYGAWEIYLNGRLVQRAGLVRVIPAQVPDPHKLPAVVVPAGGPAEQVLAIRFAPSQSPLRRLGTEPQLLEVFLRSEAQVQQRADGEVRTAILYGAVTGIFGLLTLLHLAFFRYYPAQRANLYFAFFALGLALNCLVGLILWALASPPLEVLLLLTFALGFFSLGAYLWAVRALYALFHFRPGWLYKGLWTAFWVVVALRLYEPAYQVYVAAPLLLLTFVELLRLTGRALRQRQRGAWMVGAGFAVILLMMLVAFGSFAVSALLKVPNPLKAVSTGLNTLLLLVLYLAPALGISLYLAREFALDSQLLQVKLGEVERLSAQTLAQEQDKQALLAAQNETLEHQVQQRTGELQRSLTDLRATQAQLIQKEKMASLGELTAGIAHEIQNPLNFVNNFSDVSAELVAELREERAKGPAADAALEAELWEDLTQNLGKIGHHGRRAAGIVKGMLEHSQTSAGERAPTDLNRLCEEYLRLAYQGLRAKDKTFNATLDTTFLADLPPVTLVGADVGRVLLNLFTNAFYAVRQRQQQAEAGYQPQVGVRTLLVEQQVQIQVSDNGTGMSPAVQAKIFQPFFTTKPTGEGTGLGLSLSHDIIAQGHGGTLSVASQEGQGTTFCVGLPLNGAAH
ncbi:ATP-binding protein [Hymenobacter arizonensis]|uniref:histidine kinase n=1 Tax=Hymenobacter arizonensis TaxID=1227077 RepID=A0A1I6BDP2_HYMAR|nr:ATP-binding protein [Hymenobacter arizonensis]SFQ78897.1 His Kinase A (phospho-acceptor) domain-containing protein [Hymenobacter arizonensis]